MPLLTTIKQAWFHPKEFFPSLKDTGFGPAWKYFALIQLVPTIILLAVNLSVAAGPRGNQLSIVSIPGSNLLTVLFSAISGYVLSLILIFVGAAILHVFVYLLGGRAGYQKTFSSAIYGGTPIILLSWIVVALGSLGLLGLIAGVLIALAFGIWAIYNTAIGLSALHRISTGRAVLAILLPAIIAFAITFLFGLLFTLWLNSLSRVI